MAMSATALVSHQDSHQQFRPPKKMSGNLVVAGQTALGGEIAKDYSSTTYY
jgi:hypothetical protein